MPATIPQCQHQLQKFMEKYKIDSGAPTNERKFDKKNGEISSDIDDEQETPKVDAKGNKIEEETSVPKSKRHFVSNKAPVDGKDCQSVLNLEEFLQHHKHEVKNPKQTFFDLTQKYYTDKYSSYDSQGNLIKDENKRFLDVKSYLQTENHDNFILDMQLEIIQTN